ncbi:MAG: endonuclease [Oscillospiraceae bacterium]|nr:endonuclease [Oscillospiraceae bacterium]
MTHKLRRLLSLLLAVCIVLSLITGMFLTVHAVGENAIRNWGVRDTVCTQLSSSALSYYTGNYTYATLKSLSGASSTSNSLTAAQNNQLFNALHTLMEDTHDSAAISGITYSSHSTWYAYTDCENGDTSGNMKLLWAGGYRTWDGSYVNREHVWCKSHATYVETNGGADLHHLRPASAYVNQTPHNNRPYGSANANGGSTTQDENGNFGGWYLNANTNYPEGLYEPPDNAKGDCARIILYVYTRWKQPNLYTSLDTTSSAYLNFVEETPSGTCDGTYCIESLSTLLSWCEMDPVDTWEMGRNDSVQSIQGNRNVFIDYPELAWYMFGMTPPSSMTTPSGDAANNGVSYSITSVNVNNPSYGTATITNSNTVTITPAAGCYIQSATSTSGTCTIVGNVITVNGMTANATVSVVLAQNPSYTVSFTVPSGVTQASMTGYANDSITLPTPTGTPTANAHNYEFLGWVSGSVSDTTTQPTYYAAGSSYTITGNATLIALYRYTENTGSGAVSFDPSGQGGTFVLAANVNGTYYGLPVSGLGGARPVGSTITVTNGAVTSANASGYEWTLAPSGSGFTISDGNGTYLTYSGSSTSLASDTSGYVWNVTANDATSWQFICPNATTRALIFRAGSYNYFAAYAISNLTSNATEYFPLEVLPIGSGAATQTYYTTNLTSSCNHNYGAWTSNNDGTHSKTCSLCNNVVTENCTYTTSTSGLTTTYTCSVCGYSYSQTLNSYTISYNVLGTVTSTDTVTQGNSVTLPTAPAYTGYTFEGWATSAINPETSTVPSTMTGTYTPSASITLYAVYSRVDQNGSSTAYVLVTDTNQLATGKNLIIAAKDYDYGMADVFGTYYRNQASVTKNGNTLTPDSGVIPFTLGTGNASGTWSLYDTQNSAYLTAYQSGSYYDLGTEANVSANSSFSISVNSSDGTASLTTNSGSCVVKYYRTSSYEEFKCVSSSASSTYNLDITLYVETTIPNTVTYYTTQPVVTCAHTSTTIVGAFAATCTGQGYTGDEICDSCGATVTAGSVIPALGHSYTSAVTTAATCTAPGVTTYTCSRCNDTYTDNTVPAATGHSYTSAVTTAATCTSAGVTTYTCSNCGDTYTDNTLPAALGHNYTSAVTTAATCGAAGVRTYTCSRCNDTYTEPIPATGNHTYGTCASNNNGTHSQTCSVCGDVVTSSCSYTTTTQGIHVTHTCTACGYSYTDTLSTWTITYVNCNYPSVVTCIDGNSLNFPSGDGVSIGGTDYAFVGWVDAKVSETTTRPTTIHTAGESFTPSGNATYYALYSSSTDGTPYEEFRLVTSTSELAAGDEVVVAARSAAYAIQQSNTTISRTSVSKSNNNANLTVNSATVYTLENGYVNGTWGFKSNGYYLAVSRQSITGSNTAAYATSWTIGSIDASNGGTVMSAKRSSTEQVRYLRYSSNAFSASSSSSNTVCLYKKYITTPQITSYTTELDLHVHQYTSAITTPATCTESGVMTYTCSCGDSYTETIAALGHNYVDHAAQAATCTDVGWNAYQTCSRCDYTTYQAIPALGHNIVADAAVAATCTESGLTAGEHCTRCDYAVAQETVPALGHNYIAGTPVAATCTAAGYTPYTCDRCGDSYNGDAVAALGHDLVTDPAVAATCTETGLTAGEHCTRCDYAVAQEVVSALGHDLVYYEGVAATCTVAGYESYHDCTRCDYTDYTVIPALGHDLVYEDNQDGLTHIVSCSRCYDYYIAAEGHTFVNGVCTLCGAEQRTLKLVSASPVLNDKIDMIYAAYIPDGYSNPYVVFVFNGVTTTVTEHTTDEYNRELFVFNDINPQCMGDNISATLYATREGSVESYSVPTYSVRQYCVNKLADEPPIPLQAIVSNLLAYGAAAQVYMNYKTNALVTSGDDIVNPLYYDFDEIGSVSGYDASFAGTAASDVYWISAKLTLTNSVAMNFRFYAESTADLYVTFTVNGDSYVTNEFTTIGDGVYEVSFADISANEFATAVTASFVRNEQQVGNALTYSVNAYVQAKQNDSNTALQNLIRALYLYGLSAEDYGGYVG